MTVALADDPVATLGAQVGRLRIVRPRWRAGAGVAQADDGDEVMGAVSAAKLLGVDRSTLYKTPAETLPYTEVGTGAGRAPTRRYLREHVMALKRLREERAGSLPARVEQLESTSTDHAAELAELRARVERLERRQPPTSG